MGDQWVAKGLMFLQGILRLIRLPKCTDSFESSQQLCTCQLVPYAGNLLKYKATSNNNNMPICPSKLTTIKYMIIARLFLDFIQYFQTNQDFRLECEIKNQFSYLSTETYVVGTQKSHLT